MVEYQTQFKRLRLQLEHLTSFPDFYYISSFIGGLKNEIKPMVRLLKLATLYMVIE